MALKVRVDCRLLWDVLYGGDDIMIVESQQQLIGSGDVTDQPMSPETSTRTNIRTFTSLPLLTTHHSAYIG
jgi:hypothetical protein